MRYAALAACACALSVAGAASLPAADEKGDAVQLHVRGLESDDSKVRQTAARALSKMGADARPALEALSGALGDKDEVVSYRASKALVNLWPDCVSALAGHLSSDRRHVRKNAADALKALALDGKDCTAAAPALVACLGDRSARVVTRCSASLVAMGMPAVPSLVEGLGHPDPAVRFGAATALGRLGHDAGGAASLLAEGLKDDDPGVREACAGALGRIGPAAKETIPSLVEALGSEDVELRCRVVEVLGSIGVEGGGTEAFPHLIRGLGDASQRVRSRASDSLARAGSEAVPVLTGELSAPNPRLRAASAKTLGKIGTDAAGAVPGLAKGLEDDDRSVRDACAVALGKMGPAARQAVPALIGALDDDDVDIRCRVVDALSGMSGGEEGVIEALIASFADRSSRVSNRAKAAVTQWGPASGPALAAALSHEDYRISLGAARALQQIDECPESAVPHLVLALDSGIDEVQDTALVVLGRIGPGAREALPAIREVEESDRGSSIRRRAGEVIKLIEEE